MADVINRGLLRSLRLTLYGLKRRFGGTVYVFTLADAETNYTTGVKTSTQGFTRIPRAIILPIQVQREEVKALSSNKSFVFGGSYDAKTRLFVIDARDVAADFEIDLDDWIHYNGSRFSLKSIEKLELDAGWLLVATAIARETGPLTPQIVLDNLTLSQSSTTLVL